MTASFHNNLGNSQYQNVKPTWIFLQQGLMKVAVVKTGMLDTQSSSNLHHQHTNTLFLHTRCPSYHPSNSVKALKASHHRDKYKLVCPRGTQTGALAVANINVNGNGKVILDTHPESDQHQN